MKRARRERISRDPPYGWRLSRDGKHIEPEPREQAAVALAQKLRRSGLSLRRIGHRLAKRGYTPRAATRWHPQTIASITKRSCRTGRAARRRNPISRKINPDRQSFSRITLMSLA